MLDQVSLEDVDGPRRQISLGQPKKQKYLSQDPQNGAIYKCLNVLVLDCPQTYPGIVVKGHMKGQDWGGKLQF